MTSNYLTSGSTGIPKSVKISALELDYMVLDTAVVLAHFGVTAQSKVLLALPSFPWAVGGVFHEACRKLGAESYPIGLRAWEEPALSMWGRENITHIVSPPTLIDAPEATSTKFRRSVTFIVVGQLLTSKSEARIRARWDPIAILRIYGTTEFGTLAYQDKDGSDVLRFNPRFEYRVDDQAILQVSSPDGVSRTTGDAVERIEAPGLGIWGGRFGARLLGRKDEVIHLRDGTAVHGEMVEQLREKLDVEFVQILHSSTDDREVLTIKIVGECHFEDSEVAEIFRATSPELGDLDFFRDLGLRLERDCMMVNLRKGSGPKVPAVAAEIGGS